jgi:hypothetical protein
VAAGCGAGPTSAKDRFDVTFDTSAANSAEEHGADLRQLVAHALDRINALLPGPKTAIFIEYDAASNVIPQTGTDGFTNPQTGHITIGFGPGSQTSYQTTLSFWLPRTLSHEINHSVRILAGPGFGTSLLEDTITEGISSVFDEAAFPGPPNPWDNALKASQECTMWKQAKPLLGNSGLYSQWMFGGGGIPHWTAFAIGYHIVRDYLHHHPHTSWATLTSTSASAILAGSHYQPCTQP